MAKKKTTKKKAARKKTVSGKKPAPRKPSGKAKGKAAKKAVKKAAKQTEKKAVRKSTKKTSKKTAKKTSGKKAPKTAAKKKTSPAKKTAKKTVKKVVRKKAAAKKTSKKVAPPRSAKEKTAKKTAKKTSSKTTKKTAPKPPGKPAPAPQTPRRAYGAYGGVLVCENPKLFPEKSPYSKKDLISLRQMLLKERSHLLEVLRELDETTFHTSSDNAGGTSPVHSTHLFEGASENMATETALLVRRDEEAALEQVDAALERLKHSLYGVCVACANKIGMPRLKAKPDAHLCIKCKLIYDKKSARR